MLNYFQVANSEPKKRAVLITLFVLGVILFYLTYDILTDPEIYSNNIYTGQLWLANHVNRILASD